MKKASLVIFVILLPLLAWGYVTLAGSSTKMKELVTRSEGEITTYKNQIRDSEAEMKKAGEDSKTKGKEAIELKSVLDDLRIADADRKQSVKAKESFLSGLKSGSGRSSSYGRPGFGNAYGKIAFEDGLWLEENGCQGKDCRELELDVGVGSGADESPQLRLREYGSGSDGSSIFLGDGQKAKLISIAPLNPDDTYSIELPAKRYYLTFGKGDLEYCPLSEAGEVECTIEIGSGFALRHDIRIGAQKP